MNLLRLRSDAKMAKALLTALLLVCALFSFDTSDGRWL